MTHASASTLNGEAAPPPSRSARYWLLRGLAQGPVVKVNGPYAISGSWWKQPTFREYHFAETKNGQNLWVFFDRGRNRWFLQGEVG